MILRACSQESQHCCASLTPTHLLPGPPPPGLSRQEGVCQQLLTMGPEVTRQVLSRSNCYTEQWLVLSTSGKWLLEFEATVNSPRKDS